MTKIELIGKLKEKLEEQLEEEEILFQKRKGNNGIIQIGLGIKRQEREITPLFLLNPYWEEYRAGIPIEKIIERIYADDRERRFVLERKEQKGLEWEFYKNRIVFRVVNRKANQEWLREHPFVPFLDLAIVFFLFIGEQKEGGMFLPIAEKEKKEWEVETKELYHYAKKNTPKYFPCQIEKIENVIKTLKEKEGKSVDWEREEEGPNLYVATTSHYRFGASILLYEGLLNTFAKQQEGNLLVIPSSIHEVLLLREEEWINKKQLVYTIKEVNQTEVAKEEQLSNSLYRYCKEKAQLEIAKKGEDLEVNF